MINKTTWSDINGETCVTLIDWMPVEIRGVSVLIILILRVSIPLSCEILQHVMQLWTFKTFKCHYGYLLNWCFHIYFWFTSCVYTKLSYCYKQLIVFWRCTKSLGDWGLLLECCISSYLKLPSEFRGQGLVCIIMNMYFKKLVETTFLEYKFIS